MSATRTQAGGGRQQPPPFPPSASLDGRADAFAASLMQRAGPSADALRSLLVVAGVMDRQGRMCPRNSTASRLNSNGAPLQMCLTTPADRDAQTETRLLIDPFFDRPATQRIAESLALAVDLARHAGLDLPLSHLGPMAALPGVGAVWLALPLTHRGRPLPNPAAAGLAAYLNPEVFGYAPWPDTVSRLDALLPASARRAALLDRAADMATPVCVALEAGKGRALRVKLYLRATGGDLGALLSELNAGQRPKGPLHILAPRAPWPATGVTLGLSFCPESGAVDGAKLDLCLCPDCRAAAGVAGGIRQRLGDLIPRAAMPENADLALLGFAGGGKGGRMNAYFAPCDAPC